MNRNEIYRYANTKKFHSNFEHGKHEFDGKKTAILVWKDIQSEYIKEALKSSGAMRYSAIGSQLTQYGSSVYIIFTYFTKDQVVSKKPFHWLIISLPPNELTTVLSEWYELLKNQSELLILMEKEKGDINYNISIAVSKAEFRNLITILELAVSKWDGINNSLNLIKDMESALMEQIKAAETSIIKTITEFDAESALLEETKKRIIIHTNSSELAYRIATQDGDRALQNYLERLSDKIPENSLNEFLSEKGSTFFEDIYRTWLFGHKYLRASREISNNKNHIAIGLTHDGLWSLKEIPIELDSAGEIFNFSERYRYLLKRNWNNLIAEKDILFRMPEVLKLYNLGNLPKRTQFDQLNRILQLAALEQQYSIESQSIIEVNKKGCVEIEYLPVARNGLECLFKVTIQKKLDYNECLVGEINAADGYIDFVGNPVDDSIRDYLKLILFIVAIAFRDLIVARERLGRRSLYKGFKQEIRKTKSQVNSTPLRYIPRIKGNIDSNFANPNRLVKRLKEIAPHARIAHLRGLPEGYKNSENAKKLANDYGWILPEGKTFVSSSNVNRLEGADSEVIRSRFRSISLLEILF